MKLIGFLGLVSLAGAVYISACSDDDSTSTTTTATSSSSKTSATSTGSSMGGQGGGGLDCAQICTDLFQCGLEMDGGMQLCVGFDAADQDTFLTGDPNDPTDGCVVTCENMPALAGLVDPTDCPGTIGTLKPLSPDFECACDNGVGDPACSGAGGAGGAGGN